MNLFLLSHAIREVTSILKTCVFSLEYEINVLDRNVSRNVKLFEMPNEIVFREMSENESFDSNL